MAALEIKLDKVDRIFEPNEGITGVVVVHSQGSSSHSGISLLLEGTVKLQLSARSVGLKAFYTTVKPIQLMSYPVEVHPGGKLPDGRSEFPFEFFLKPFSGKTLYETYHGVYVNIEYLLTADMIRSMLSKNLKKTIEFTVQIPNAPTNYQEQRKPVPFTISPETLQNVKNVRSAKIPQFLIDGTFDSGICMVNEPFTGEIFVRNCDVEIKSIELQFVRVETCAYAEGDIREATEVQNIQLADGNVCKNFGIPIHMIFPRLFTCATTITKHFKVEFEVNVVVLFQDGHMLTENFPIKLVRGKRGKDIVYI